MNILRWFAGALVGGALGAAIWAAVTVYANHEVGWVAWGVGGLCGFLVQKFSAPHLGSKVPGVIAAIVAVLAIVGGKYASVHILVERQIPAAIDLSEPTILPGLADEIVKERLAKGEQLTWPEGMSLQDAARPEDYPKGIWEEAQERWKGKTTDEQAQHKAVVRRNHDEGLANFRMMMREGAFKESFSPIDLLFGFLAISTAFRLGSQPVHPELVVADPFKRDEPADPFA
jgi:hypothetical protein